MAGFVIRRALYLRGGTMQLGADTNLYRSAANILATDDALTVGGSVTATGAATFSSAIAVAGSVTVSGSPFVGEYGTVDTTSTVNGQVAVRHVTHVPYLVIRSGGTSYSMEIPTSDHGTATFLVV